MSWDSFLGAADGCPDPEAHIADAYETTNILFSSGTTGKKDFSAFASDWTCLLRHFVGLTLRQKVMYTLQRLV